MTLVKVFVLFYRNQRFIESVCFSFILLLLFYLLRSCPSPGSMDGIISKAQQLGIQNNNDNNNIVMASEIPLNRIINQEMDGPLLWVLFILVEGGWAFDPSNSSASLPTTYE